MLAPPRPPQDDTQALMKEARERQLRRRLLGAAGIAVAAAIDLGIYALTISGGSAKTTDGEAGGRAGVPLCRSSQLSSLPIGFPTPSGDVGGLEFRNVGSVACSLPGTPRVAAYLHGRRLPLRQLPADASVPNRHGPIVHVLAPGKRAYVVFSWSNWCEPHPYAHPPLRYSFGGGLVLSQTSPEPACVAPGSSSILRVAGPLA